MSASLWQLINYAPQTGKRLLLYGREGAVVEEWWYSGSWNPEAGRWEDDSGEQLIPTHFRHFDRPEPPA